jgi:hypothetical protein
MSVYVNNGGVWTLSKEIWVNNGGTWIEPQEVYINNAGTWTLSHKVVYIAANATNVNLFSVVGSPTSALRLKVVINAGVTIYGTTPSVPALTIGGFASRSQLLLINNGSIIGAGGYGGSGSTYGGGFVNSPQAGGHALSVSSLINIQNNGIIAGGGGGGGQGGWGTFSQVSGKSTYTYSVGGSGGGGGAGTVPGAGGAAGGGGNYAGSAGAYGSATGGGAGGVSTGTGYYGGTGGGLGAPGASGYPAGSYYSGGAAAGYYAVGNGNITWDVVGTRLGNVA